MTFVDKKLKNIRQTNGNFPIPSQFPASSSKVVMATITIYFQACLVYHMH